MKKSKILSLVVVAVLVTSTVLTGCSSTKKETASSSSSTVDTSKEVKLVGYLLGAAPAGFNDVMGKLNEKLKKDINATMDINYIGWGDIQSKYPLILASGEDVDWVFTASWNKYQEEAVKGAFREVTTSDMEKYMPLHYAKLDKEAYKEASIKGKNYMIPTSTPDKKVPVVAIRGDLRKKYNVPEIKKFSDIEPYLAAIKQNEPNMIPLNLDSQYDLSQPFGFLETENGYQPMNVAQSVTTDFFDLSGNVYNLLGPDNGSAFKKAAATMKEWYDKGFINKNPFANKVRSKDALVQGKSGIGIGNAIDIQSTLSQGKANGMDLELIPIVNKDGKSPADSYLGNGVAIAANSKNPERAMMALDRIMEQKDYDMLVYYGIEGKNYVINSDSKLDLPQGVTAESNTYPPDAAGFWFTNKDIFPILATWTDNYVALKKQIPSMLKSTPWQNFTFDQTNVKTEVANLTQADTQYANPVYVGSVSNVDSAISTLLDKEKAAGWQKVYDEAVKQGKSYLSSVK